jgi:hypothetical protein
MFTAAVSAAPDAVGIPRLSAGMSLAANQAMFRRLTGGK